MTMSSDYYDASTTPGDGPHMVPEEPQTVPAPDYENEDDGRVT
jgi:hypothetical protein